LKTKFRFYPSQIIHFAIIFQSSLEGTSVNRFFSFKNGFSKGDLMVIVGVKNVKIGDVIIFNGGSNHPIIHRVVSLNPIQTKGDHNSAQLTPNNNGSGTDETNISQDKIIGTAVLRIPYLGWIKLFFAELLQKV
jgi:signal peptidase I